MCIRDRIQTLDDPNSSDFISGVSVVSSAGLTTPGDNTNGADDDFTHFDAISQIEFGERFASTLASTATVPEPSSLAVLGLLSGVVAIRRRR